MGGGGARWHGLVSALLVLLPLSGMAEGEARRLTFYSTESPPIWSEHLHQGGLGGEILQAMAHAAGFKAVIEYLPLKRYEGLEGGNRMGNPLFFVGREFAAVVPLLATDAVFCHYRPHHPDGPAYRTWSDLKGGALGVERGTLEDTQAFLHLGIRVEENMTLEGLFKKLRAGRVDVVLVIDVMGYYYIEQLFPGEVDDFLCVEVPGGMTPIAIMLEDDTPEARALADTMRATLERLVEDGTYRRILTKYYGASRLPQDWTAKLRGILRLYQEMPITLYGD